MRAQEVGISQFRETFDTSSAPVANGSDPRNNFAVVLHQATEGTDASAVSKVATNEQDANSSERLVLSQQRNTSAQPRHARTVTGHTLGSEHATPKRSVTSIESAHRVAMQAGEKKINPAAPEEEIVPLADDLVASANKVSTADFAKPSQAFYVAKTDQQVSQNIRFRVQGNEISAPSIIAAKVESSAKPTKVGEETQTAKIETLDAKASHSKSSIDSQATTDVTNPSGPDRQLDIASNETMSKAVVVPQRHIPGLVTTSADPGTSHSVLGTNQTISLVGQPAGVRQGETAADKKADVKTADETTADTKLNAAKSVSSVASNETVQAGTAAESSLRDMLAGGAIPLGSQLSAGHPSDSRAVSVMPAAHEHAPEPAGSLPTMEPQMQGMPGGTAPHSILNSSATSLEVGVASGTHGWLKIRAEMAENGEVNASLTGSSPVAANRLRDDLPALNSYLQSEKVQVNELNVHTVLPGAGFSTGTTSANTSSDRSSYDGSGSFAGNADSGTAGGRSQQRDGQGPSNAPVSRGSESGSEILLDRTSDATALGHGVGLGGKADLPPVGYAIGGGWLSVRV